MKQSKGSAVSYVMDKNDVHPLNENSRAALCQRARMFLQHFAAQHPEAWTTLVSISQIDLHGKEEA